MRSLPLDELITFDQASQLQRLQVEIPTVGVATAEVKPGSVQNQRLLSTFPRNRGAGSPLLLFPQAYYWEDAHIIGEAANTAGLSDPGKEATTGAPRV